MYMLEGLSRWNQSRARESVEVVGASALRSFDVRLMSHLNSISRRVLGSTLVPEFTPPGEPTGKTAVARVTTLVAQTSTTSYILCSR